MSQEPIILKLVNRYNTDKIDQEFMDLEFARWDYEEQVQIESCFCEFMEMIESQ